MKKNLGESPDERFRLRYMMPDDYQEKYADVVVNDLLPAVCEWNAHNLPWEEDINTVSVLAIEAVADSA